MCELNLLYSIKKGPNRLFLYIHLDVPPYYNIIYSPKYSYAFEISLTKHFLY